MTICPSELHVNGPYETFQDEKAPKTFNLRGFLDNLRLPEILVWYRGPDLNRQAVRRRIFITLRLSTPTSNKTPSTKTTLIKTVRALDYAFTIAQCAAGAPRLVSTPSYRKPLNSAFTTGLARCCLGASAPGVSPNLKGSTPTVSDRALNYLSPLCLPISSPRQGGRDSTTAAPREPDSCAASRHSCRTAQTKSLTPRRKKSSQYCHFD